MQELRRGSPLRGAAQGFGVIAVENHYNALTDFSPSDVIVDRLAHTGMVNANKRILIDPECPFLAVLRPNPDCFRGNFQHVGQQYARVR